jgi:carbonic anhydrase
MARLIITLKDKTLAVLGFFIEISDSSKGSPFLTRVFTNIDKIAQPGTITNTGPLDFTDLRRLLHKSDVYQYTGSLTTPPCTEGVAWNVVSQALMMEPSVFRRMKRVLRFNSRYHQNVPNAVNLLDHARVVLDS